MSSIVRIDGEKIKTLRERQGLTQLYLATVVGVTTDTISRWENRRSRTIKQENGLKLAEALEVSLEDILESEKPKKPEKEQEDLVGGKPISDLFKTPRKSLLSEAPIMLALCFAGVLALVSMNFFQLGEHPSFQSNRILPAHTAPGTTFPVIITISGATETPVSILLRDELSCNCETRELSDIDKGKKFGNKPRWIGRVDKQTSSFAYEVHTLKTLHEGEEIIFKGDFVTKKDSENGEKIGGAERIAIAPFHWADSNRDYSISDDEILMVYEDFSAAEKGGFTFEEVEELWLAGHYSWNKEKLLFETGGPVKK